MLRQKQAFSFGFILFVLLAAQSLLNLKISLMDAVWVEMPEEASPWDANLFRIISFGHLPTAVDWLWIKAITDPAMSHVPKGVHPKVYYDIDLATDVDPGFMAIYLTGSRILAVIRDDALGARDILQKAEAFRKSTLPKLGEEFKFRFWSYEWQLPLMLAYVELFELSNLQAAAAAFKEAAAIPGSPAYLQSLKKRFEKPGGEYEVGIRILKFMIAGANEPRVKAELEKKLGSIQVSEYLFQINHQFKEFSRSKRTMDQSKLFKEFVTKKSISMTDPWGGRIKMSESGKIVTSTPHSIVFGLE